jgi:tetratricopeptide (TPR) repeat protein
MWERALAGYEKALGQDHPDTLGVVLNLGSVYYDRGKFEEAERMWERALTGYKKAPRSNYQGIFGVLTNRSWRHLS